jgi:hypothetical protein
MEAGKNSVIYMGLISGPNKADDTCGRTTVTGTMDRGFTVLCFFQLQARYDGDMKTAKLRTQKLDTEQKTLLKDKQLLTSEAEELKSKLQVLRKHTVYLTGNITTE